MEEPERVEPAAEQVFWQDWGDWDDERRAEVGRTWAEGVQRTAASRGFNDESTALAKRFNPHHTRFHSHRKMPRYWFNLQVTPAPQRGEDFTRWWVTVDDEEPFALLGDWGHGEHGLPGLPITFCAHHLLGVDSVYGRGVYVTYRLELLGELFTGSDITLWADPKLSMGITQEHMRAAPSVTVALESVIPSLLAHSDTWQGTDADARKVARRLLPEHSERRGPTRFELERIAEAYNNADDQPMKAVQDRFGLTPSTARNRIREARRLGLVTRAAPQGGRPRKTGDQDR